MRKLSRDTKALPTLLSIPCIKNAEAVAGLVKLSEHGVAVVAHVDSSASDADSLVYHLDLRFEEFEGVRDYCADCAGDRC